MHNHADGAMGRTALQKEKALTNWPWTVSTGSCSAEGKPSGVFGPPNKCTDPSVVWTVTWRRGSVITNQRCSRRHVLLCGHTWAASIAAAIPKSPRACISLSMKAGEHSQDVNMQTVFHPLGDLRAVDSDLPGLRPIPRRSGYYQ